MLASASMLAMIMELLMLPLPSSVDMTLETLNFILSLITSYSKRMGTPKVETIGSS